MKQEARGAFIAIEGIDGSGTTTQSELLVRRVLDSGSRAMHTAEPSSLFIGKLARAAIEGRREDDPLPFDWKTFALLFAGDRLDHVARTIKPMLESGVHVVCCRYLLSSLVYQPQSAPIAERAAARLWVKDINRYAMLPDLTIVLDCTAEEAARRRAARSGDVHLFDGIDFQRSIARQFHEAAFTGSSVRALMQGARVEPVDANAHASVEAVASAVAAVAEPVLAQWEETWAGTRFAK